MSLPEQSANVEARRYLTIVQDARGYPPPNARLDLAPPDGPAPPVVHSVVLADDYERIAKELDLLRRVIDETYEAGEGHEDPEDALQAMREVLAPHVEAWKS